MNDQNSNLSVGDAFALLNSNGYPRSFVERLLPDWWDNNLLKTSSGSLQFALIIKQRLGLEVSFSEDGSLRLNEENYSVRFKHRRNTQQGDLNVVKNLGKAAASLARHTISEYKPLPHDPSVLREYILHQTGSANISFEGLLDVCWLHGIPVLFLETLPKGAKRMTGMVVNCYGKPSILLGFRHSHKARQLFILAHEIGHLALGHVEDETLLIDEDLDSELETLNDAIEMDLDAEEKEADQFALSLIRGQHNFSFAHFKLEQPTELALFAMEEGERHQIDPGHIIVSYAFETLDWPTANIAMNFFENSNEAINTIKHVFLKNAALNNLSEEARSYLQILQGY